MYLCTLHAKACLSYSWRKLVTSLCFWCPSGLRSLKSF